MLKRNRPLTRHTPLKRFTPLKRTVYYKQIPLSGVPGDPELTEYYRRSIIGSTWICENCGEYIPHGQQWQLYSAQCHIVDKEKYPEVRGHLLNRLHLCVRCHNDWDSSWKKAASMPVFALAKALFASFRHLLRKIPAVFLRQNP